jgi:hypothetical protein
LDEEGQDSDPDEKHVVEDSFENIDLSKFNLLGVDLVENLHEYEYLEDISEMEGFLGRNV